MPSGHPSPSPSRTGPGAAPPRSRFSGPRSGACSRSCPRRATALSATERTALRAIEAGASTPTAAFLGAQDFEPAPFLGDSWFFRALAELGRGEARLVETADGDELPAPPPLGDGRRFAGLPIRLTATGRRALAGDEDRVELLGIDRWVGGTHVVPDAVWRWDAVGRRLVAP